MKQEINFHVEFQLTFMEYLDTGFFELSLHEANEGYGTHPLFIYESISTGETVAWEWSSTLQSDPFHFMLRLNVTLYP